MDAALLVLHDKIKKENDVKKVKEEVRTLKRKRQALIDQENKMRDDINRGELGAPSSYRLPLSVNSNSSNKGDAGTSLTYEEIRRLKQTANTKQKLKGVAMCYGVTSHRDEEGGVTKFMFDPYIAGKPYGPFNVCIQFSRSLFINTRVVSICHTNFL